MTDPPRLDVFPIAIGHYDHYPHLDVDTQIAAIAELFADFGGHLVPWDIGTDQRGRDAVDTRLAGWANATAGASVLYWVGHGWSNTTAASLAHARSPNPPGPSGVLPQQIGDAIAKRYGEPTDGWAIVIVDACRSARFVQLLSAEVDNRLDAPAVLLVGVSGDGTTNLGRFTRTLRTILRSTFRGDPRITLWDLTRELRRSLPPHAEAIPKHIDDAVLHRTRGVSMVGAPLDVIDEVDIALAALTEDERRHFIPKAQGGELGEQAWYFQGRQAESHAIAHWLRHHDQGLLVVTGAPGSGKSALLGQLIVRSRPELRAVLARHNLITDAPREQCPPDDAFDVVVHLAGLSIHEVLARLATDAGLGPPSSEADLNTQLDWLIERMAARAPVTILADALDEAVDPVAVANAVLRRLATVPRVRVLVGTRRGTHEGPDQPTPTDHNLLDALRATDDNTVTVTHDTTAIARYVANRLRAASPVADQGQLIDASVAIGTSGREFLFARLAVHEILADPALLTPDGIDDLVGCDHRELFARAVDRLAAQHPTRHALLRALALGRGRGLPIRDGVWATVAGACAADIDITDTDIGDLLVAAAPYVLLDREHDQTVYRLAHRTFVEHFTTDTNPTPTDRATHHRITLALTSTAAGRDGPLNPYLAHYLSAHAGLAGQPAWQTLADRPALLDRLDSQAVAADAMRTAFGHFPLPPAIAGVIGARHLLATANPTDRAGLRQLAMTRHTPIRDPAAHEATPTDSWTVRWAALSASPTHLTLANQTSEVTAVAALPLPDGQVLLATGGFDGTVRIWDPLSGTPIGDPLTGHNGVVFAMGALPLPDGRAALATGGFDGTVRVWDALSGAPVGAALTGHTKEVSAVAALPLPDGRVLLATGGGDPTVRIWDPLSGAPVGAPLTSTSPVSAMTALPLPDRDPLLAIGGVAGEVRIWDPLSGTPVGQPLTGHTARVWAMAPLVVDGRVLLATAGEDHMVRIWNPVSGRAVGQPLTGHTGGALAVATLPLPDGHGLLATGDQGGMVRIWDPASGTPIGEPFVGHAGRVWSATALPLADHRVLLVTGGGDNTARIWDPGACTPVGETRGGRNDWVWAVATLPLPDGRTLLATGGNDGTARIWDPLTGTPIGMPLTGHTARVGTVAAVPLADGRTLLATGSADGTLRIWDPLTGVPIGTPLSSRTGGVRAVIAVPLPDGRTLLAAGGDDGAVRIWDPLTGAPIGTPMTGHDDWVWALAALPLPDGRTLLATGSDDGTVRIWDPLTGASIGRPLTGHTAWVRTLAALPLPDGRTLLAAGGIDGTVRLWDPLTGAPIGTPLTGHTARVRAATALSLADGRTMLATGGRDHTVRIWDPLTSRQPRVLSIGMTVTALAHLGGDQLAIGTTEGMAVISLSGR